MDAWKRMAAVVAVMGCWAATAAAAEGEWHTRLWLGRGNVWAKRVAIVVRNDTGEAWAGKHVGVRVGTGEGEADVAGVPAGTLRACDAAGVELLFAVLGADGKKLEAGPVPGGAVIVIPAECAAKASATGYIYFDNRDAWAVAEFLDVRERPTVMAAAGKVEAMPGRRAGEALAGEATRPGLGVSARAYNGSDRPAAGLVAVEGRAIEGYLAARRRKAGLSVRVGAEEVAVARVGDALVFPATVPARTLQAWHVRVTDAAAADDGLAAYERLAVSPENLVRDGGFEAGAAWGGMEAARRAGVEMGSVEGGRLGKRAGRIRVPAEANGAWVGWRQDVKVSGGRTYLYAAWVRTEGVAAGGAVRLHAHLRRADGQLAGERAMTSVGPDLKGTTPWTLLGGMIDVPADAATFEVHLTTNSAGTVWHDGVIVAPVTRAMTGPIESRTDADAPEVSAWAVDPIVKVFQHDLPPAEAAATTSATAVAARNEREPIQVAIRSRADLKGVRVGVDALKHVSGATLKDVKVEVVGYVPVDYATNYYQFPSTWPAWRRKVITQAPACDGWSDLWPDPLLPRDTLDLAADRTAAAWVTVSVPKEAAAGEYRGAVTFTHEGKEVARVPVTLRVFDFALEDESHVKAIYDVRVGGRWRSAGKTDEQVRRELVKFMADRRLCPDRVLPEPKLRYEDGKVIADFAEFDAAATWYFDELKLPHSYTPHAFYGFGWGLPPRAAFGQEPYSGSRPFAGADRSKLRPEYVAAYQACLRAFWAHLEEKGWEKKVILYISDEPFDKEPAIEAQMKAICAMIREAVPELPIYSSTWHHVPAWDGFITAWGVGHYGVVPPEKLAALRAGGARVIFTTDGHMCLDTPYCAVERLLPHYCFKYGVEGYEFWGSTWLTFDPHRFGWHSFIPQTDAPGKSYFIRYPNGDGYLIYPPSPGAPVGHDGPISTVRLEQAREGVEDYEYLWTLQQRMSKAKAAGQDTAEAERAMELARGLVSIPNAGGRYSTRVLEDPGRVRAVKEALGRAIEGLR